MVSQLRRLALALLVFGLCFVICSSIAKFDRWPPPFEEFARSRAAPKPSENHPSEEHPPPDFATVSSEQPVPQTPQTRTEPTVETRQTREELIAERERLWQEAKEFAAKQNWIEAVRSGEAFLALQRRHFADRPIDTCRMLELTCFWHSRQRAFPQALAAARALAQLRTQLLGELHWQTVDARLLVTLNERLSKLTDKEWEQFLAADALHAQAAALQRAGKYPAALEKAEQALRLYRNLLGSENAITLTCLSNALFCRLELGQYYEAHPLVQELIEPQIRVKGVLHPQTIDCLRMLARFNEATGNLAHAEDPLRKILEIYVATTGPSHPDAIAARAEVGRIFSERGNFAEAEPILIAALRQQRDLFGGEHLATANTMKVLGAMYGKQGKFAEAEPLLVKSLEVFRELAGDKHLATASACNALGKMRLDAGQLRQAESDLMDSRAVCLEALGDDHPVTAKVMNNLAELYELSTNTGPAREIRLHCLRIAETSCGQISLPAADALERLARAYIAMNDFGLAEPYLLRAREIRRKILGEEHLQTAEVVSQLAYCYLGVDDPDRAEPLFKNALATVEKTSGPDSLAAAKIRRRLALLYQSQGKFEEAERNYREAIRLIEEHGGPVDYATATAKVGLAQTMLSCGDCEEACRLIEDAIRGYSGFPPDHPEWIDLLGIGGTAHLAAGAWKTAEPMLKRGLRLAQLRMEMTSPFSSEHQRLAQLMIMRNMFDLYLSLPSSSSAAELLYPHVLSWKGAVAIAQWRDRRHAGDESLPLITELQQIGRSLSTLMLHVPGVADREERVREIFNLNMRKETLEEQLAIETSKLHGGRQIEVSMAGVQRVIPPQTALIDFLSFSQTAFENQDGVLQLVKRDRCIAFIVRSDRPVACVDLGEMAPITEAVTKLQQSQGFRPNKGKTDWAATVGKLVWSPLWAHLDDCNTVLISPDTVLTRLPWSLLPGRKSGRYLIEDFSIGLVAVPQLMPVMFAAGRPPDCDIGRPEEALLLVGDVDYDAGTPSASEAGIGQVHSGKFSPLKGTAAEVQALRNQFQRSFPAGEVLLLGKAAATEEAFRREVPRHRWLHIATHGFFARPNKSAPEIESRMNPAAKASDRVSVFDVGVLNGLAMAGANVGGVGDGDNGILTAMELSTMDLRIVDIAVLSGCETGLGEVLTGEGSFGLQRALQTAGVGATVASLWTVSDEKTNLLMQRFYANLWDKKLTRLEALREAQLWMLNTGGAATTDSKSPGQRTSPHYWAAFSLSGDWR